MFSNFYAVELLLDELLQDEELLLLQELLDEELLLQLEELDELLQEEDELDEELASICSNIASISYVSGEIPVNQVLFTDINFP